MCLCLCQVTILFLDLMGFTAACGMMAAEEVIAFLNQLFSKYDKLVEQHRVQKVRLPTLYCYGALCLPVLHVCRAAVLRLIRRSIALVSHLLQMSCAGKGRYPAVHCTMHGW